MSDDNGFSVPQRPARLVEELYDKDLAQVPAWIQPAILPHCGKMILGGEAKIGKSLVVMEIAYSLALAAPLFGHKDWVVQEPARVLILEKEVGRLGMAQRVKAQLTSLTRTERREINDRTFFVTSEGAVKLGERAGYDLICSYIEEVRPNVLFLDPIGKMHNLDENRADDMNRLNDQLDSLRYRYRDLGLAVVFTHHFKKGPDMVLPGGRHELDPYNFRGSTRWVDDPDTIMTMVRKQTRTEVRADGTTYKWWEGNARYTTRHMEPPDDFRLNFNQAEDLRVVWGGYVDVKGRLIT